MNHLMSVTILAVALFSAPAYSLVYEDAPVGKYKASFDLNSYTGVTFLTFMKNQIFPALNAEAKKRFEEEHIDAIALGQGVEVRLSEDVSTFHVKYKAYGQEKAERSGRSFSAVGKGARVAYVADASYKHYLTTLGKLVKGNPEDIRQFYTTVIQIIANSDPSGVDQLSVANKQVLADFVAVYVAEQFRHMIGGDGDGDLGPRHNWDDAHLQVTLLAAFHGGQKPGAAAGMFYEGKFTNKVFKQINKISEEDDACVYKQKRDPVRKTLKRRNINLTDYWQFNPECERSGVNMTRSDFSKMGSAITSWISSQSPAVAKAAKAVVGPKSTNVIKGVAELFVNDDSPEKLSAKNVKLVTQAIVDFLMQSYEDAQKITNSLAR